MWPSASTAATLSAAVSRRAPGMPRSPRVGPASHAPTDPARTDGRSGPSVDPALRAAASSAATLHPASTRAMPVTPSTEAMRSSEPRSSSTPLGGGCTGASALPRTRSGSFHARTTATARPSEAMLGGETR